MPPKKNINTNLVREKNSKKKNNTLNNIIDSFNVNKKKQNNDKIHEFGTEVDEDGQTDTDYNDELEDEYNDVEEDEVVKEEDNIDDNIDVDENADYESNNDDEISTDNDESEEPENDVSDEVIADDDDGCLYNFDKKNKDLDSDDEFDDLVFDDDDDDIDNDVNSIYINGDDRITGNVLTKYERVRILAERSKQLMLGAKPMLKFTENIHPKDIARLELERGVIPYKVHRERPDGKIEIWKISELKLVN